MIIFGWNFQTTWFIGPVFKRTCDHCNNEEFWTLVRRTTWFTLFFIPVIPYKTEWLLLCPICKYGLDLKQDQVDILRPIAEVNQLLNTGVITAEEYHLRVAALNNAAPDASPAELLPEAQKIQEEVKDEPSKYCGACGKEVVPQGQFCVHCGTQINKTNSVAI
ncbi:MAG TPA: zinc-ribbon domain-containing protein [Candidatus Paceibacterota bacterium]|jgi:hypothetical protein|nr:zinc-ribbon domain-containing protein [Candidatus Paceibacterota bacterium]